MYHTTGFTRDGIVELCARVHALNEAPVESEKVTWPPILGLFTSVIVTLTYLRRNRIQVEIGETYGVSQSTVSRAVMALTPRGYRTCLRQRLKCAVARVIRPRPSWPSSQPGRAALW
jgi:hypothetical protein